MTGDDLRAIGTWVDWRGNPPKVTIPAATRDALADLIDAVAMLNEPVPLEWPVGKFVWRPIHERALDDITNALAALDQEAPT